MKKIAVVDDDAGFGKLVHRILEKHGYEPYLFLNAGEALEFIDETPVNLLITDVLMPDMDGIELLTAIKRKIVGLPVIVMSGGGRVAADFYLETMRGLGAKHVLEKPFDTEKLLGMVAALV